MTDAVVFDESTRRKLEQVSLYAARARSGAVKGERRSTKRGTSIEFADYRDYTPGDDLRRLDWNVYARLNRPLTKLFEDEEDLAVHVLIDTSASMGGSPPDEQLMLPADQHKFTYARRLLAGLAYLSLTTDDRLTASGLNQSAAQQFGPARGRNYGSRLFQWVNALDTSGTTDLNASLRDYALRMKRSGVVIVITDLFSPNGFMDGLNALLGKGCDVTVIHVLTPDEIEPPMTGDLRLIDVENGIAQEVSIDAGMRRLYVERLEAWRESCRADCAKRGARYVFVPTSTPWEKVILHDLRKLGVVR
jgi:uncharacterized protein (DUF58 family)